MGEKKLEPLITREVLAEHFGMSKDAVDDLRNKQGLPFYKLGNQVRFRVSEVEKWLEQRKQNG